MEPAIGTVSYLREQLIAVLKEVDGTSSIGTYLRPPPLTPIPAIFVGKRPDQQGLKLKVSDEKAATPVPALEVIISGRPEYRSAGRNIGSRLFDESWRVYLIFHDPRQKAKRSIANILANFKTASDVTYIPGSDLVPDQYTISICNPLQIGINR